MQFFFHFFTFIKNGVEGEDIIDVICPWGEKKDAWVGIIRKQDYVSELFKDEMHLLQLPQV